VIDTDGAYIGDEPKTSADMGIIYNGPGQINDITDPFNEYSGKIGIEVRGSSSQMFPKKPYGLELRDANNNGISMPLLGLPTEEDWVLIATYNDKTLMRDALAYKIARDMGRYAARVRFVEVVFKVNSVVNGELVKTNDYQGIYMLAERIKRDDNRVNISKLNPDEVSGDDVTGGYILKIDKTTGNSGNGFYSAILPSSGNGTRTYFQYEYPKHDEIVPQQMAYIQNYIKQFESVLSSTTYDDPVNGYAKYIDVDSFIDFLIVNEISRNVDGYRLSTFLYKDKESDGGKITMGPVWDFNLAFGNANYCQGAFTSGWAYDFNSVCPTDGWQVPFWWQRLLTDHNFKQKLGARWRQLRETTLKNSFINDYIDSLATVLKSEATARNFAKWPVLGTYVWPNEYVGPTYDSEVSWMKSWIGSRLLWLDIKMPNEINTSTENDKFGAIDVTVSPNPSNDVFEIAYSLARPANVYIELADGLGRKLFQNEYVHRETGTFTSSINASALSPGLYIVKVTTSNKQSALHRVVKR
jgi:hypothetical protein